MTNSVTAVIPTYTNTAGLKYLLPELKKAKIPTVLVDNQPTAEKGTLAQLHNVNYLPQSKNTGFAQAVNIGSKVANTSWLLILNDDIELKKNGFAELVTDLISFAGKNKLIAVSPVLVNKEGRVENYGYRVLPQGKVELNLDSQNKNIDGLTAACLLIKRQVFLEVGGFDRRFFAYLEDVDLFLRLKERGYKFAVNTKTVVIHNHLTTSSKMPKGFKEWHDFKNWILITSKHRLEFKLNPDMLYERLRNISGLIKRF